VVRKMAGVIPQEKKVQTALRLRYTALKIRQNIENLKFAAEVKRHYYYS
jgi:hypothetical protein